jgi:hypothetical protein
MFKTGISSIDLFSQAIAFIPLLPVVIILLRGIYQKDVLTFLLILCLVNCIGGLLSRISKSTIAVPASTQHLFSLVEFIILIQMLKSGITGRLKNVLDIFLIAFISSVFTYYLIEGADQNITSIARVQDGIIILIAIFCMSKLIGNNDLNIFSLPLFWISVGTVFYFVVADILEAAGCCSVQSLPTITDKILLLNIASLVRYFFYILAAFSYRPSKNSDIIP